MAQKSLQNLLPDSLYTLTMLHSPPSYCWSFKAKVPTPEVQVDQRWSLASCPKMPVKEMGSGKGQEKIFNWHDHARKDRVERGSGPKFHSNNRYKNEGREAKFQS